MCHKPSVTTVCNGAHIFTSVDAIKLNSTTIVIYQFDTQLGPLYIAKLALWILNANA